MFSILHITPHLNGGLGQVLLSTIKNANLHNSDFHHKIVVLEPLSEKSKKLFSKYIDCINEFECEKSLSLEIKKADIIQIEWWNHPLIYKLLFLFNFPPCRIIILCHISGFYRPQIINKNIVNFSDIFMAATKATLNNVIFKSYSKAEINKKVKVVTYPPDLERLKNFSFKAHEEFNIGYVGTLDYSKLHFNFLSMSSKINIENAKFLIYGDDENNKLATESLKLKKNKFEFRGFQPDIRKAFEELDIFGYPLSDTHFGSGEQVIIEAMYVGLPIVAFDNPAEKIIIKNGKTGILVKNEKEYIKAIEFLYNNPKKREEMGRNARENIIDRYSPKKCFDELNNIYLKFLSYKKTQHKLMTSHDKIIIDNKMDICLGAKLFIDSLGADKNEFADSFFLRNRDNFNHLDTAIMNVEQALKVKTKGSMFQYLNFFSNDPYLNFWAGLFKLKENNINKAKYYFKKSEKSSINIANIPHVY